MRRLLTSALLCLILVIGLTIPALAQGSATIKRVVDSGELRVGMSGTQPPFSVKSKDGKLIGYEVDLANMLADAMGAKAKIVEMPFGKLLDSRETGEVDVVMSGMTMTPRRNARVAFVGPYIVSGKSILTKDSTIAALKEAEELDKSSISLVALENSTSQRWVERLMPAAKLVTVSNYDDGVNMVLEDKVTAMVADMPIAAISVMRHQDKGLVTTVEPLSIEPIGIALAPGDSLLLNMVENYLGALEVLGVFDKLEDKWFGDASWMINVP
jgi:polar amino acid transport system substrate-binding protein